MLRFWGRSRHALRFSLRFARIVEGVVSGGLDLSEGQRNTRPGFVFIEPVERRISRVVRTAHIGLLRNKSRSRGGIGCAHSASTRWLNVRLEYLGTFGVLSQLA